MNIVQRITLLLGVAVVAAICLRPPYQQECTTYLLTGDSRVPHKVSVAIKSINHHWIWSPPEGHMKDGFMPTSELDPFMEWSTGWIDWPRLGVYVGLVAAVMLSLILGVARPRQKAF